MYPVSEQFKNKILEPARRFRGKVIIPAPAGMEKVIYSRPSPAINPDTGAEIPADTPIYVDFAGGRKGSLMCEGTDNLLTANQSSFEISSEAQTSARCSHAQSSDWAKHGTKSQKITITDATGESYMWYRRAISGLAGDPFTVQAVVYVPPGCWYIGKNFQIRIRFGGGVHPTGGFAIATYVLQEGENLLSVTALLDYADRNIIDFFLWEAGEGHIAPIDTVLYTDCHQVEPKAYFTPWQIGGSTRANPIKQITLSAPLPATFAIGIAAKMLHAHDTADRTFWQCGGYRCYFGYSDNKIKITNGVVTAETAAVTWAADDYVGVYAGRENGNLFIQAKVAGVVGEKAEVVGDAVDSGVNLYVASKSDGRESVNATIGGFAVHDCPEDIDPIKFLSSVPGGGGE